MTGHNVHCHKLICATAIEMAGALYDEVMKDNSIYAHWKAICPELTPTMTEILFIEQMWPHLIGQARATLARMLTMEYADDLKMQIHDALCKDATLKRGRTPKGALTPKIEGGRVVFH